MSQITDIKPQKKDPRRFNIYVDGKFAFALPSETLVKEGLKIDQQISQEEIQKLVKENEFLKVYDRVLKFFSYRPRSEKELKDWFARKQVGQETQEMILQKMRNLGYLNDEEFAQWWIEQRTTFRPAGTRLLAMELRQKGIEKNLIARLLDCLAKPGPASRDYIAGDVEKELAKKVAEKKLKSLKHLPSLELKQKLSGVLARRGFSWETIKEVVGDLTK